MDIISLPIEIEKEKVDGRFRLVNIAAQRAKLLASGAKPEVETNYRKIATIAIQEVLEGEVKYLTGEKARKAREIAEKLDIKKILEEKEALESEEVSELEKDLQVYMQEKEEPTSPDELFSSEE